MAHFPWIDAFTFKDQGVDCVTVTPNTMTFCPVNMGSKLDIKQVMHPREVANGTGGNQKSILGPAHAEFDGEVMVSPQATTGAPFCGPFLTAGGFVEVAPNTLSVDYNYNLTVDEDDYKYLSMTSYSGSKQGDSIIKKAINLMFEGSIEGKVGEPCKMKLKGMGAVDGTPQDGAFFTGSTTVTENVISILKKVAMIIAAKTYKILEFSISPGHKVQLIADGSTYGYERGILAPGPATFKCKILCEDLGTANPFDSLVGQTVDDFEITWGTTPHGVQIISGNSQIDAVEEADESGIKVFNLSGHFVDNDLSINFNI